MTTVDFADGWIDPVYAQSQADFKARVDAADENGARPATVAFTHRTTGVGDFVDGAVLNFGCVFLAVPAFTSGVGVVQPPDTKYFKYPQCFAGVYEWIADKSKGGYTGCKIYYSVNCPSKVDYGSQVTTLEGTRQNVHYLQLQQQLYKQAGDEARAQATKTSHDSLSASYYQAQQAYSLAVSQLAQIQSLKKCVVDHHLVFYGVALKMMSEDLMANLDMGF